MTWRLPLSHHFSFLERRPFLPLISSSIGVFYPWRGCAIISINFPMELLKSFSFTLLDYSTWVALILWGITKSIVLLFQHVARTLLACRNLIMIGGRRKNDNSNKTTDDTKENDSAGSYWSRQFPSPQSRRLTIYNKEISERFGLSFLVQLTEERGFEFRFRSWILYLATLEYLCSALGQMIDAIPFKNLNIGDDTTVTATTTTTNNKKKNKAGSVVEDQDNTNQFVRSNGMVVAEWLRRKTGSIGISLSPYTEERPFYSCTGIMTLSNFYYGGTILRKLVMAPFTQAVVVEEETVSHHTIQQPSSDVYKKGSHFGTQRGNPTTTTTTTKTTRSTTSD